PAGDCYTWLPVPEDRDQAFIDFDGLLMKLVRWIEPKYVRFQEQYPDHRGLPRNAWEVDRQLLAELEWSAWDSVATTVQAELPDPVIEDAVRRLPAPYYEQVGDFLTQALKTRRDHLGEFAVRYYKFISREIEIKATDEDEDLELEHRENGELEVRISWAGTQNAPYFRRTLYPHETKEVRIYLHGGDDQVAVLGEKAKIRIRVDGGGGDDAYANQSRAGRWMTRFYDARGDNRFDAHKALIDERLYKRPAPSGMVTDRYVIDWGMETIALPVVSYSPDLGAYAGLSYTRIYHGYRKNPYASQHSFDLGVTASATTKPLVAYFGKFRHLLRDLDGLLQMEYSSFNVIRFNGFGNDLEIPHAESFYEVEQAQFLFAPTLLWVSGRSRGMWTLTGGPLVKFTDTSLHDNKGKFIASYETPLYGTEAFGQIGVGGELVYDARDNSGHTRRGVRFMLSGELYPKLWDVESAFGHVAGDASAYLSASVPTLPTLALRMGGKTVRGAFPFYEAATVGGPDNLRGFREDRFAGESALYGNGEFRVRLTRLRVPSPGELGAFAAVDAGRVFYDDDPEEADGWHIGTGGGLWISFLNHRATLSAAMMEGEDLTGLYLRGGFMF
ncbi:MAG: BamA/TamA family outer membrane protein, partial [Rhodospirillales bacterium]|nr:BamA/TamA family outer membrane protein [Rhodospirillales bacterium]